jgi:DNA-binding NarL/FixJ family response regulator
MNEAFPLAYALLRQGEALIAAGERTPAAEALSEARRLGQAMGATAMLEEIEALARAARVRARARRWRRPARRGCPVTANDPLDEFGLTSREREVLMLTADGRSNGQIADELVISRKTASVHVSNILGKLGVATRVEAAAPVHRRGGARAPADA